VQIPEITIITPVFNGAKYIRNCIDNFLAQDCAQAEHLIMDGASTDGTVEILKEYAAKHSNVRYISEKDSGQSNAMNKGIRAAKGKIIGFLNVDDCYEPNVLNKVVKLFQGLPEPSFVCANLNMWNPDGTFRHLNRPAKVNTVNILTNLEEWPYNPTSYFYHKSLHEKVGYYDENEHFAMDYDFIIRATFATNFVYIDEVWGNFHMVEASKTLKEEQRSSDAIHLRGQAVRDKYYKQLPLKDKIKVNWHKKKRDLDLYFKRLIKALKIRLLTK
jgi:glycosyltransferase involved in cell wall biosynthesis